MPNEYLATDEKPFHFVDSGLENVFLVGIRYFKDEDGTTTAEIPAAKQLMRLLARNLLFSSGTLTGKEIRFLRKRLGMKAGDFAKVLGLEAETLSRIENEKQSLSEQVDKLTRMSYLLLCHDPALAEDAKRLMDLVQSAVEKRKPAKRIMKISAANEWEDFPTAA